MAVSSGILKGVGAELAVTRIPRGVTELPIANGTFLTDVVLVPPSGFRVLDVGNYKFKFQFQAIGSGGDVPYTVEVFNKTLSSVVAFVDDIAPNNGHGGKELCTAFPVVVSSGVHEYVFRVNAPGGGFNQDSAFELIGPIFTSCIEAVGAAGGPGAASSLSKNDISIPALVTTADEDPAFAGGISSTPVSNGMVFVHVNADLLELGDGVKTKDCYFADPATPGIPRLISNIQAGDSLRWMGSNVGYQLSVGDVINLVYTI